MTIQSAFDEMLEDQECPKCRTIGMMPNGGFDWVCPNCGYEGSVVEEEEEEEE